MSNATDLTLSGLARLIISINTSNPNNLKPFTAADLVFGIPVPASSIDPRNTKVVITPTATHNQIGKRTLYYRRLGLVDAIGTSWPELIRTGLTMSHELLPALLTDYGINLGTDDVINENIVGLGDYTFVATPGSIGWVGEATVLLMHLALPPDNSLLLRIDNQTLLDLGGSFMRLN